MPVIDLEPDETTPLYAQESIDEREPENEVEKILDNKSFFQSPIGLLMVATFPVILIICSVVAYTIFWYAVVLTHNTYMGWILGTIGMFMLTTVCIYPIVLLCWTDCGQRDPESLCTANQRSMKMASAAIKYYYSTVVGTTCSCMVILILVNSASQDSPMLMFAIYMILSLIAVISVFCSICVCTHAND